MDEPRLTRQRRRRRRSAAGTARRARAGTPPGRRPGRAAAARSRPRSPAPRAGAARHAPGRRRTAMRAGHAESAAQTALGSPAAGTSGPPRGPRRRTGPRRTRTYPARSDRAPHRVPPSSSPLPAHPAAYPACAFPPAPAPAAACAAACGRAGRPMTGVSTSSRCCVTSHAPAGRPAPAAPPPRPEAKLPPPHGPRSSRNPGPQGAGRTQAMIIQSRPAVSKTTRSAGLQQSHAAPAIMHRQQNRAPFQGGECYPQCSLRNLIELC
jgi:hypothetical protein